VLTGLPVDDPAAPARPVLGIKIDNNAAARPQVGLNQADIVYEELVEQASRYLAVFQSHLSDPVGPVRSARATDIDIMANLGKLPLFANSGGNNNVMTAVNNAPLVPVGHSSSAGGFFYRQSGRRAPHNLFVKTSDLYSKAEPGSAPPASFFQFAAVGAPPPALGGPTAGVGLDFASNKAKYRWNAQTASWDRELDGTPHVDGDDVLISPENVVVMFVRYGASSTPGSPKADTVGTGDVWVLTRGVLAPGTWTRNTPDDPYTFTDSTGAPILLTPGQTWMELSQDGAARVLDPGE
jgi:hypothetical protein